MTLADKKIEEFWNKFDTDCSFVGKKASISISGRLHFANWLRKALAEAERDGQIKAYKYITNENKEAKDSNEEISKRLQLSGNALIEANQRINCFGNQIIMCENKLKELEEEK